MRVTAATALLGVVILLAGTVAPAAVAQERAPITAPDYSQWETLGGGVLAPDGAHLAVSIRRVDGTTELRIFAINMTDPESGPPSDPKVVESGSAPQFANNARWLAYRIGYSEAEQKRMREDDRPIRNRIGLLELASGEEEILEGVASFQFDDSGEYLVIRGYPAEEAEAADVVIRTLESGSSINFGNVSAFAWQDNAPRLAMTILTESGAGNGIQLYDATSSSLFVLDSGDATFTQPAWRKDEDDLAVLRSEESESHEEPAHVVLAWRDLASGMSNALRFDHRGRADFPIGLRVIEDRAPSWSDDGQAIFFGVREWPEKPPDETADETAGEETGEEAATDDEAEAGDEEEADETTEAGGDDETSADDADTEELEPADVDVWHALDERIIPMQKLQEERDRAKSYLSVWHVDEDRFVQLGTDLDETVALLEGQAHATETDRKPYIFDGMFGRRWFDVDLIDVATGERTRVVDRIRYFSGSSATGEHLLYFKDDTHFSYEIASGEHTDLTSGLPTEFVNQDDDHPVEQKRSWGLAGWAEDDEAVLLYDRYDIWSVRPDGDGALRLTDGADDEIRYRYVRLDAAQAGFGRGFGRGGGQQGGIDLDEPLYLSMFGQWTKMSGYARLDLTGEGREPTRLIWLDAGVGRLVKAADADQFAYVIQDFDDSPDYFVGPNLAHAVKITHTNPFQTDFAWGHSELIDYSCEFGKRVQGALFYPAGYRSGREYPMITYVYERLSQSVHNYSVPSERSSYNPAVWTSLGYFVLQPDIFFRGRRPGTSAVECIRPAVQTVVETGMIDGDRVGLVGHSWGGYEAAYVPTRTDIFAASVSGAALTNFFSMFGTIHWNQGLPESSHFETGQARMDVPYWDDMEAYVRESPVMGIPQLETPMLMAFGDNDGTVDWHQGVEMYNYARRAGKMFVMLVYADENHSNRQEKNQVDYHHRILDWFGHYLKGEPAKPWITDGVSVMERNDELKRRGRQR